MTAGHDPPDEVHSEVRGLFGRDSMYMGLWALQLVIAAAVTPAVTRLLTPAEFGGVTSAVAVMQVVAILAGLGLQTAIQRQHSHHRDDAGAARLLLVCLIAAAAVVAALDLTGPRWDSVLGFASYDGALRLAVYWAGLSAFSNAALGLLRSQDRLAPFTVICFLQSIAGVALAVGLVLAVSATATMFVLGQLLAQAAAAGLALLLVPPRWLRRQDVRLLRTGLAYALPLVPTMLCDFVLGASDRLIINSRLGATAVARYQVAYNIGSMPTILLDLLNSVWMPRIFGLGSSALRSSVLAESRDALYRLLLPVMVGLALGAPVMLRIWAPPEYRTDALLVTTCIVIVSSVPYAAGLAAMRLLLAVGRSPAVAVGSITAAAANVGLNLILVTRYGLAGAAVSTLLAFVLLHVLFAVAARREGHVASPPGLLIRLGAGCLLTLATSAVPGDGMFLVLRVVGTLACVGWFVVVAVQISRPTPLRLGARQA